jgi:hypothetical protein
MASGANFLPPRHSHGPESEALLRRILNASSNDESTAAVGEKLDVNGAWRAGGV